jgi:arabinose-5-phosphate isomerase
MVTKNFKASALALIDKEIDAIAHLKNLIDENFEKACALMLACERRVVVMGLGKSGHVGGKIAATLASTGTPAFFVHAAEAIHGDFGMLMTGDILLAISNSGKTSEILTLIPHVKAAKIPLIAMTSDPTSPLAHEADVVLNMGVDKEACDLTLAPTSSSTVSLVLGDALAVALLHARGFTMDDFARTHPGGTLGKRLLLTVSELMHSGAAIPKVPKTARLKDALIEMTAKRMGVTTIVDDKDRLLGIFTDGDLRRVLEKHEKPLECSIESVMTAHCKTISADVLAFEALIQMEQGNKKITVMPVINSENILVGILHLHDILAAGVV